MRSCIELFLPTFLIESGVSNWLAGSSTSLLLAAGIFGNIAGGYLNDKFGARIVMVISLLMTAAGLILFSQSENLLQIVSIMITGVGSMMMIQVGMSYIQESFPDNRSFANGIYLAQFFGINALASVFTGFLYDQFGGTKTFLWSGLLGLFGLPFVLLLPKLTKTKPSN